MALGDRRNRILHEISDRLIREVVEGMVVSMIAGKASKLCSEVIKHSKVVDRSLFCAEGGFFGELLKEGEKLLGDGLLYYVQVCGEVSLEIVVSDFEEFLQSKLRIMTVLQR